MTPLCSRIPHTAGSTRGLGSPPRWQLAGELLGEECPVLDLCRAGTLQALGGNEGNPPSAQHQDFSLCPETSFCKPLEKSVPK